MVAVKAYQADKYLESLDGRIPAILVYGSDDGMVAERARKAALRLVQLSNPPGEVLRLEDADLEGDSGRLATELQTIPMFGGRKIVRLTASRRITAQLLRPLLEPGALVGSLVVEAGNLKPDDALRNLFEKATTAAAVACYADEARDLERMVRETLSAAGLDIAPDARQLLVSRLGADRALSRGEIDKLVLYARGCRTVDLDDIDAIVGDASELAVDKIVLSAASGDGGRAVIQFDRAIAAGENAQAIVAAVQRHLQRLHRVRTMIESGRSFEDVLKGLKPPIHFKQKAQFEEQCRMWTGARLATALSRTARAAKAARLTSVLEQAIAGELLLEVAGLAKSNAKRRA
jgi:DNA polymerase-3 subunit delta